MSDFNAQQVAQQVLLTIRGIPPQIPSFVFLPPAERRRLSAGASVPLPFMISAASALDASKLLVGAMGGVTGERIRFALDLRSYFLPVADEMEMIGSGMRHTVLTELSGAGTVALQVYALSKTLNRSADREVLIPHIEAMRRHLDRSRSRSTTTEPEPEPQPLPPSADAANAGPKKAGA